MRKHTYKLTFQSSLQFIFFYKLFTRLFSKMEGDAKKEKFSKQIKTSFQLKSKLQNVRYSNASGIQMSPVFKCLRYSNVSGIQMSPVFKWLVLRSPLWCSVHIWIPLYLRFILFLIGCVQSSFASDVSCLWSPSQLFSIVCSSTLEIRNWCKFQKS